MIARAGGSKKGGGARGSPATNPNQVTTMTDDDLNFLSIIGSTEETTFNELCAGLGDDRPQERSEWRLLFLRIERYEADGYLEVSRLNGRIEGMMLTEQGAALIRERKDSERGLLSIEGV